MLPAAVLKDACNPRGFRGFVEKTILVAWVNTAVLPIRCYIRLEYVKEYSLVIVRRENDDGQSAAMELLNDHVEAE